MKKTPSSPGNKPPRFIDNSAATQNFISITIDAYKILPSWQNSILSRDWLEPDGRLKAITALKGDHQKQSLQILDALKSGEPIPKPVLGIGIMDHVEIGSGRAIFAALLSQGIDHIPVHIPKSNQDEFEAFV